MTTLATMTADELHREIKANVDLYWAGKIPHSQFTARQGELWRAIEASTETEERVLYLIRESQKQAGIC